MILVVHVDDVFAVGKERCDQFGEDLKRMVPVKNLGELKFYSGCFYERDREAGRLKISQQTYTEELGEKFAVKWGGSIPFCLRLARFMSSMSMSQLSVVFSES